MTDPAPTQQQAADHHLRLALRVVGHGATCASVMVNGDCDCHHGRATAELDALVARNTDLEAQKDEALRYAEKCVNEAAAAEAQVEGWRATANEFTDKYVLANGDREAAEAQVAALTQSRDEWHQLFIDAMEKTVAAEARCAGLQQALERIADENDPLEGIGSEMEFAREALAGSDTPADSHYRERPIEEDFYLDPRGEWVYRWSDERRVLKPADSQEDKT